MVSSRAANPARVRLRTLVHRAGPWTLSILFHAIVITFGLIVTWSILTEDERLASPLVTSDIITMTPVVPLYDLPIQKESSLPPTPPSMPALEPLPPPTPISAPALQTRSMPESPPSATFAGTPLGAARDVVFVLDASGSMIAWLPFVIDEVERTLTSMHPDQRFAVRYFAGDAVHATTPRRLTDVTAASVTAATKALRRDAGRRMQRGRGSDPRQALEAAIQLKPDLVLLMSEGLNGRGHWEVDRAVVMRALDQFNPVDPLTGTRPVRIECIRLVSGGEDPAPLMESIAATHGGGSMRTVTLEELER
ncbi:MAG: hypothetical protein MK077_06725 [Phycisphaerales bacterium]|nr:hypothetical protein [Phycisphaerales bacterium]